MKKNVLVTGATGFVGSHILEALMDDDTLKLIAACRDEKKLLDSFKGEVRVGNLLDKDFIENVVKDVDIICHAAAWTSLWGHEQESNDLFLLPSLKLIDAAKKAGVQKFIFTSSTAMADPKFSADALSEGIPRDFWPHMCNVIQIENSLKEASNDSFKVVNLRLGLFIGKRYNLGFLPILLPRLKTHLVPWIDGGKTHLPLVDGRDIGQAFSRAVSVDISKNFEAFNIVGQELPTVREVISFLHDEFHYPKPHFSVPFFIAYIFGWTMERLNPLMPNDPLVTRSIVHLMEDTKANNNKANRYLGYSPKHFWKDTLREQLEEIQKRELKPMRMAVEQKGL